MKKPLPHLRFRRQGRRLAATQGFSMVELIVSGVVGAIVISSVTALSNSTQAKISSSRANNSTSIEVASNLAQVRKLADEYVWTNEGTGSVALNPTDPRTDICRNKGQAKKNDCTSYFLPSQKTAAYDAFEAACKDNTKTDTNLLLAPLITAINAVPRPAGISRTVTVHDGVAKQLLVSYSGGGTTRAGLILPKLASLCP